MPRGSKVQKKTVNDKESSRNVNITELQTSKPKLHHSHSKYFEEILKENRLGEWLHNPQEEFERRCGAIYIIACNPETCQSPVLVDERPYVESRALGDLFKLEWVRINEVRRETRKNPWLHVYIGSDPEFYPEVSDWNDTGLLEWPEDDDCVEKAYYKSVNGAEVPSVMNDRERPWASLEVPTQQFDVYGSIEFIDICGKLAHRVAFKRPLPTGTEAEHHGASVVSGNLLMLNGPSLPVSSLERYNIKVNLEACFLNNGEISSDPPMQVAKGIITWMSYPYELNDTYIFEKVVGTNGSVTLCYSAILDAVFVRFGATLHTDQVARHESGIFHIHGSITVKEEECPFEEKYLFHADREHCKQIRNGDAIPLLRNSVSVIKNNKIAISIDLKDRASGPEGDVQIAKGNTEVCATLYPRTTHPGEEVKQHVNGVKLIVGVVADCGVFF